jgi:exodeoxyribonuclease X
MWKPRKPIEYGAMATHHIVAADLADFPEWPGSWPLPAGVEYLIGHGVDFDWRCIGQPHVARICTLALARNLWPALDSHKLAALAYFLLPTDEARDLTRDAHNASADVRMCWLVVEHILAKLPACTTWHDVWVASEKARVPERMTFGKYGPDSDWAKASGEKGMRCADVKRFDYGYYKWLFDKCDQVRDDPYLQKALRGEAA